jgi:hypothetical protein
LQYWPRLTLSDKHGQPALGEPAYPSPQLKSLFLQHGDLPAEQFAALSGEIRLLFSAEYSERAIWPFI